MIEICCILCESQLVVLEPWSWLVVDESVEVVGALVLVPLIGADASVELVVGVGLGVTNEGMLRQKLISEYCSNLIVVNVPPVYCSLGWIH